MIFDTLLPHATFMAASGQVEESCFVLQRCRFNLEAFKDAFEQNRLLAKPKTKLNLPILFDGQIENLAPGRFQGSNAGNASNNTFKKIRKKEAFPSEWFPWLLSPKNEMAWDEFEALIQRFNDTSPETIYELFTDGGPLFTFKPKKKKKTDKAGTLLEQMAARSVYQVVTCRQPTLAVHSVLALNALNEKADLIGEKRDPELIPRELFKFCLLFWMLNQMKPLKITDDGIKKGVGIIPQYITLGNIGNIDQSPLLLNAGEFRLGAHTDQIRTSHPIVNKFASLTRENTIDRISLTRSNKVFTAPATGKAPTNAYCQTDRKSALAPEIMLGIDRDAIDRFLPAYSLIIQDKAFTLTKELKYYVFLEDVRQTDRYLRFLENMISQLKVYKQDYFDCLKKSAASSKAKEKKKKALERIQSQRKDFWGKSWNQFKLSALLFALEENVGSVNQPQYTWTSVYRNLPAAKAFVLLEMLDDPSAFGRLATFLSHTSLNLSEGWKEKETKRLIDRYFLSGRLDQIDCWLRWRKYLTRSNATEKPIDAGLWEHAMSMMIQLKIMGALHADPEWSGKVLLENLKKRRKQMDEENQGIIGAYLTDFFFPRKVDQRSEEGNKHVDSVKKFIKQQAVNYGHFVDTKSDSWRSIIDGLICGWALKQICFKIRDDYKSVIGGKSLAKHTPAQLRTLSIDLYSKAERTGAKPWNVQAPLECMFKWSQKNPHSSGSGALLP